MKPRRIRRGSVAVSICCDRKPRQTQYIVYYTLNQRQQRHYFKTLREATSKAESVAGELASARRPDMGLNGKHLARLEVKAARYDELVRKLSGLDPEQAVQQYIERNPPSLDPRTPAQVLEEMMQVKRHSGLSTVYLRDLNNKLRRFSAVFPCHIHTLDAGMVEQWLYSLNVAPRTRNNLHRAVVTLMEFARSRKYIPAAWDEMNHVAIAREKPGAVPIFTPAQVGRLLACASPGLLPFIALGAFAGLRHWEIRRLGWANIHFDRDYEGNPGFIEVAADQAKGHRGAARRLIPLQPNLREWLAPLRRKSGPVCGYSNTSNKISGLCSASGVAWKRNGLRHSYISYRVAQVQDVPRVALEAGNSPQKIFSNYREVVTPADAARWFSILPAAITSQAAP